MALQDEELGNAILEIICPSGNITEMPGESLRKQLTSVLIEEETQYFGEIEFCISRKSSNSKLLTKARSLVNFIMNERGNGKRVTCHSVGTHGRVSKK